MNAACQAFPVLQCLLKLAQIHVHWTGDAIQPSHPLSSHSPLALILSQHQGLFQWVGSSHQVAKELELQLQHQPFQWIFRTDFLQDGLVWSPCCPSDSQESSPAPQFESISSSLLSLLYGPTLTSIRDYWKNHSLIILYKPLSAKWCLLLFNKLSRFFIAFLPRSKHLLISWPQSPSAVILEPKIGLGKIQPPALGNSGETCLILSEC